MATFSGPGGLPCVPASKLNIFSRNEQAYLLSTTRLENGYDKRQYCILSGSGKLGDKMWTVFTCSFGPGEEYLDWEPKESDFYTIIVAFSNSGKNHEASYEGKHSSDNERGVELQASLDSSSAGLKAGATRKQIKSHGFTFSSKTTEGGSSNSVTVMIRGGHNQKLCCQTASRINLCVIIKVPPCPPAALPIPLPSLAASVLPAQPAAATSAQGESGDPAALPAAAAGEVGPSSAVPAVATAAQGESGRPSALPAQAAAAAAAAGEVGPSSASAALSAPLAPLREALARIVFDHHEWNRLFSCQVDPCPLPNDLDAVLNQPCPLVEGKRVRETHGLFLIPGKVNGHSFRLYQLEKLVKELNATDRRTSFNRPSCLFPNQEEKIASSYWILAPLENSLVNTKATYKEQKESIAARKDVKFVVPTTLEIATSVFLNYLLTGNRLYSRAREMPESYHSIRCQREENASEFPPVRVGEFTDAGLVVREDTSPDQKIANLGCSGIWRFKSPSSVNYRK